MASLTKEEEEYYNNYFDMFNSKGWQQLVEELKTNLVNVNSVQSTKDVDDMYFRKGQLNVLNSIVNLDDSIDAAYKDATEDD
mgnify:CR=1 FL=1|tara:strand:+ start:212 stop:457 length:246 start_codon:yes stop_codon:yes gene_type:complete